MIRPFYIEIYKPKRGKLISHRGDYLSNNIISVNDEFLNKIFSHPITAFAYQIGGLTDKIQPPPPNPRFDKRDVIKALDFWIDYFVYQNQCDYILEDTVNKDFELTVRELIETREAVLKLPIDTQFVRNKIRIQQEEEEEDFHYSNLDTGRYYHFTHKYRQVSTNMTDKQIEKAQKQMKQIFPKTELPEHYNNKMIEFTDNVVGSSNNSSISTVDQFCYKVVKMTYK